MLLLNINLIKELLISKFNTNKSFLKESQRKTSYFNGKLLMLLSEKKDRYLIMLMEIMIIKPDQ